MSRINQNTYCKFGKTKNGIKGDYQCKIKNLRAIRIPKFTML